MFVGVVCHTIALGMETLATSVKDRNIIKKEKFDFERVKNLFSLKMKVPNSTALTWHAIKYITFCRSKNGQKKKVTKSSHRA